LIRSARRPWPWPRLFHTQGTTGFPVVPFLIHGARCSNGMSHEDGLHEIDQ